MKLGESPQNWKTFSLENSRKFVSLILAEAEVLTNDFLLACAGRLGGGRGSGWRGQVRAAGRTEPDEVAKGSEGGTEVGYLGGRGQAGVGRADTNDVAKGVEGDAAIGDLGGGEQVGPADRQEDDEEGYDELDVLADHLGHAALDVPNEDHDYFRSLSLDYPLDDVDNLVSLDHALQKYPATGEAFRRFVLGTD